MKRRPDRAPFLFGSATLTLGSVLAGATAMIGTSVVLFRATPKRV
jgi:hypothetical protein